MLATMNVLRERYQFHHRQQKPNESIEQFAAEIRRLAASCQFSALEESLIRDHVLFGLRNQKIALQVIDNGGDPSLFEIIDTCSRSGRSMRKARQHTMGEHNLFEGVEVKHEPSEEDIKVLPIFADTMPDVDDACPISRTRQETEMDDAEDGAFNVETVLLPSDADCTPLASVKVEIMELANASWTAENQYKNISSTKTGTSTKPVISLHRTKGSSLSHSKKVVKIMESTNKSTPTTRRQMRCDQCKRIFQKGFHYRNHILNKHNEGSCRFCRKTFKTQITLNFHIKAHHPETIKGNEGRQYECYVCHRDAKSIPVLRMHLSKHFRARRYLCSQCGYIAGTRHNLEKHLMRNDHNLTGPGRKPFKCELCGQIFRERYTLNLHMTTHSDVRNFPCPICGKPFKTRKNMMQHHIRHGEKTHHCQLCSYSCFGVPSLNLHMKVHTGVSYKQE